MQTNFPNEAYLKKLSVHLSKKTNSSNDYLELIKMNSGFLLNWMGDHISDKNVNWKKKIIKTKDLYLTGTNPKINKIIINKCERSPSKLSNYLKKHKKTFRLFSEFKFTKDPILIRYHEKQYKVLDGMHRVIAAIRDNIPYIQAYVAYPKSNKPQPQCEAHVIYDILRPIHQKRTKNTQGAIQALKYLKECYSNVETLLKTRFNKEYVLDKKTQEIIEKVLK